jgi:uncharacterized protein YjbJ (UPF0337 family)
MEQNKNTKTECCGSSVRGKIKAKWNKLTETDLNESEKNMEMLSCKIQKAYGRTKEVVDQEVSEFRKLNCNETAPTK